MKVLLAGLSVALLVAGSVSAHEVAAEAKNKRPVPTEEKAKATEDAAKPKPHGGGLDKYGCHTNHKTGDYHCHR